MAFFAAEAAWTEIPPAPGRIVDVGGSKRHIHCSGSGSPAVILEPGFPGSSLDWTSVQPAIAKFTRVCSYDRAGFGWSDLHESPRSAVQIAGELHLLLSNAAVPGPCVLAGHSMGSLYSRAFVRKFSEAVTGLALVDATHEDQWTFEPRRYWRFDRRGNPVTNGAPWERERQSANAQATVRAAYQATAKKSSGPCDG